MPSFQKNAFATPFGRNNFLRSTRLLLPDSFTVYAGSVTAETIDGYADQKVLQTGELMAKITSGPGAGMIGPYQAGSGAAGTAAVNEVQTINLGSASAGTVVIGFDGQPTAAVAFNATAAAVRTALETLSNIAPGDVAVTGGPLPGTITLTFGGAYAGVNVPEVTVTPTGLTGGAVTVATTTQGAPAGPLVGGATDGRGVPANIVGLNNTFLPWQLMERDVEIAVLYGCVAVQAWCFERNAAGLRIPLSNATRDASLVVPGLRLTFK